MPASPLTIAARQVSARLSTFSAIEGNIQMLRMIANEDVTTMGELAGAVAASGSGPPGMAAGLFSDAAMMRTVSQWSGNIKLWPQMTEASASVASAADFLDALPEPPVLLGTIVAAQINPAPLVMLAEGDRPLNALAVDGSSVKVEGSLWPSINDQTFTITVGDRPLAQFQLMEADTTDEVSADAGGTVWLLP